jgi:hypothetical protein
VGRSTHTLIPFPISPTLPSSTHTLNGSSIKSKGPKRHLLNVYGSVSGI